MSGKVNPNAHFTYWDKVLDHTGTQKNVDGTPFEYIGHWSWIPMLNDKYVLDYDIKPVMTRRKERLRFWSGWLHRKKHNTALAGFSAYGGLIAVKKTDGMKSDFKADFIPSIYLFLSFSLFRLISSTVQVG